MSVTLGQLATLVEGELLGDAQLEITGAAIIRDSQPGEITLADRPELAKELARSQAAAVIASGEFAPAGMPVILVKNVHAAFAKAVALFRPSLTQQTPGVHPSAIIAASAVIAPSASIGPMVVIGEGVTVHADVIIHSSAQISAGCSIGAGTTIFPGAVLYENTIVGANCILHAAAVLGAYGFGYDSSSGKHVLSAQLGNVVLHDNVEIGAATTIDRGTYGPTVIGEGTKVDNQVMIAHNCRIGRFNLICSQVGIAGSTSTGDYVVMAGQVGVRDHVHIGDGAILGAKSGISCDIGAGQNVIGAPAISAKDKKLELALLSKLPEMRKQLKALLARVDQLEKEEELRKTA
ncbi:UDP-3-O-(3-hydroxymyristoyl)glucosamine N-acyltransferase [Blastopirellula sp. JC732]|uniref:UDP-3-O-acylglucosamine N-acyltransferase n=1 Tax=Blastopirellula sediminis TaxID=2894196 RepID=A0A9X1MQQ4_9BACT|nr:UDP-3-O-(3-hydroxymyristoyl)glucosamine N-acyltransferase [Blastopirellula sediminis]MCC9606850.1 UDP-3-O-(3-hydroxymyristoyl)glucosamine N-acyltransferase [Blastopirellula sediminis]MCC9629854.1 UDP-3-O-(3-hydroxymyristoyl)glucosamine N-acyltransferase [Blastopirellula sediminis]